MPDRTDDADIARIIVASIERAETQSAPKLRQIAYRALAKVGINVDSLRRAALQDAARDLEGRVARARSLRDDHQRHLDVVRERLATLPHEPTPERIAHAGERPVIEHHDQDGAALRSPRARYAWPVDRIAPLITIEQHTAADRFRRAYHGRGTAAKVSDYGQGAGRADPSGRLGLTPMQERSFREFNVVRYRLGPEMRFVVWNFVLEESPRGWSRPMSPVEFGKAFANTTNESRARGAADAALKLACATISEIYAGYDDWRAKQRENSAPSREGCHLERVR